MTQRFKDVAEALFAIEQHEANIAIHSEEIINIQNDMIKLFCTIKVGDELIANESYKGRPIVVDKVEFFNTWQGKGFKASGRVKNKDGNLGLLVGSHCVILQKMKW
jgi:hypothetical protein